MGENNLSFKSVFPGQSRMQTKLSGIFADLTPDTQRQEWREKRKERWEK